MTRFETRLSIQSLNELIQRLEIHKNSYPQIAKRIVDRLANEMLNEVTYTKTYKLPTKTTRTGATGGIANNKVWVEFQEFGTGIVGSRFPHVAEELQRRGWKYDVNAHGEAGWWYPTTSDDKNKTKRQTEDGTWIAWTRGMPAHKEFYNALKKAEELFKVIAKEEIEREVGKKG